MRGKIRVWVCAGLVALAAAPLLASGPAAEAPVAWSVPDIGTLHDDVWGRTVRHGRDLVVHTAALIGPRAPVAARRYAGNNLDCQSCHIEAGTRAFSLPLVGAFAGYPGYRAREGAVGTIEDRVNGCMTRSMNGRPLPATSAEMTAIVAYIRFLSTGRPIGSATVGQGAGRMPELARAADPVRGRQIYARQCAICHGGHGEGRAAVDRGQGYAVPPLWGHDSFNDGAGMARLTNAANFIRNNMPDGTTWQTPYLSEPDAWDVAAYIEAQPRPHMSHLERDFPQRREKPVDTAYGPYADRFAAGQHKYGPFAPIRAAAGAGKT
jgi:thiosulfate dehydrogenase